MTSLRCPGVQLLAFHVNNMLKVKFRGKIISKPSKEDMEEILEKKYKNEEEEIFDINCKAVDNLIRILKTGVIEGSDSSGFIINGNKRHAACFQDVPLMYLSENIKMSLDYFKKSKSKKLRYCGVGLCFSKIFIYSKGGRPVIYEDREIAKNLIKDENEYWRISHYNLEYSEKYINLFDFSFEREWRVPDRFEFELLDDFTTKLPLHLIFSNRKVYEYFMERSIIDGQEADALYVNTTDENMYKEEILSFGIDENILDELREEDIYKEDFLKALNKARKNDEFIMDFSFEECIPNITIYPIKLNENNVNHPDTLYPIYTYRIVILDEISNEFMSLY